MPTILVIDDEPDVRLALSITLNDHGYEVVEGTDGSEAVDLCVAHRPDVIILDLNMPEVDGIAALEALKTDERTARVPVFILTAVTDREQERRALDLGAADILGKPWSEDRLVGAIRVLVDGSPPSAGGPPAGDSPDARYTDAFAPGWLAAERRERLGESVDFQRSIRNIGS